MTNRSAPGGEAGAAAARTVRAPTVDEKSPLLMLAELERAHRDIARSARRTEQALAAQRRFAADASHELRTPLTTIRVNAQLLLAMEADRESERAQALADVGQEAELLGRLVDNLLMLARADAGLTLTLRPTALRPVVGEARRQAQVLADRRELLLVAPEDVAVAGGRITVTLKGSDDGAELAVADTGPGIAPAEIPHIFDRLYRSAAARQADGTGLGLSIAKWIAEQHGAHIEVASVVGQGTTFTLHFPPRPASTT